MFPARERFPAEAVVIEYDRGTGRASRTFTDPYRARAFFAAKLKAGKRPVVRRHSNRGT
jgi:hypothetical protein